ncbi:MAG TPA: hypothetical protein VHD36_07850 [Pirellulales bacterium]|nr:hypothetical protein [Pirellulales bacterium]
MRALFQHRLWPALLLAAGLGTLCLSATSGEELAVDKSSNTDPAASKDFTVETLHGRLVWLGEALARLYKIESDADAAETSIVLETTDGRLVPLVKDFRSRGFWLDPRLRGIDVEMEVRRFDKSPAVQVVRWYAIRQGRKYELDYWCDICAIPMYELKTCDCCQGEIRLRERPVEK